MMTQIGLALQAISMIEGWCCAKASIAQRRDGAWLIDRYGRPVPSRRLLRVLNRLDKGDYQQALEEATKS